MEPILRAFPRTVRGASTFDALLDGVLVLAAFAFASAIWPASIDRGSTAASIGDSVRLIGLPLGAMVVAAHFGLRTYFRQHPPGSVALRALVAHLLAWFGLSLAMAMADSRYFAQHYHDLLLSGFIVLLTGFLVIRGTAALLRAHVGARRVLIAGEGPEALEVFDAIKADAMGLRQAVGYYGVPATMNSVDLGASTFDSERELADVVRTFGVREIVIARQSQLNPVQLTRDLAAHRLGRILVLSAAEFLERQRREASWDESWAERPAVRSLMRRVWAR